MNSTALLELVQRDRMEVMMRAPFYARVICSSELVFVRDPQVRMACTDYRRIYLSADSYPGLPEEQRLAVLAHEVLHIVLRHAFRIGNRDRDRFSVAADIENHFLLRDTFQEPYSIDCDENWKDLSAEQIYDLLPEDIEPPESDHCYPKTKQEQSQSNGGQQSQSSQGQGQQSSQGQQSQSAQNQQSAQGQQSQSAQNQQSAQGQQSQSAQNQQSAQGQQSQSAQNQQSAQGQPSQSSQGQGQQSSQGQQSQSAQGQGQQSQSAQGQGQQSQSAQGQGQQSQSAQGQGQQSGDGVSEFQPQFDSESEMDCRMLSEGTRMDMKKQKERGNAPAGLDLKLDNLAMPHVNWKALLRQFIRTCRGGSSCWLPPNRRFIARGLYLPGRREKLFRGVVALDTSGSTMDILSQFIAELTELLQSFGKFELTIIECDAVIQQVWKVSSYDMPVDLSKHPFKGGGGTDFTPVFEYVRENIPNPNVLIFFTDGFGDCPDEKPSYPVVWLLTQDSVSPAEWGQKIKYEEL